jgi:hypothetical protein
MHACSVHVCTCAEQGDLLLDEAAPRHVDARRLTQPAPAHSPPPLHHRPATKKKTLKSAFFYIPSILHLKNAWHAQ